MDIIPHFVNNTKIAEVISDDILINSIEEGFNLMINLYYQEYDHIIIHKKNITPDFFDLKNKMAGEILQKFSNYKVRLTIIGDFNVLKSKSLQDFIYECNKSNHVNFVESM